MDSRKAFAERSVQQEFGPGARWHVRGMDHNRQQQPHAIDQNMALPSRHFLIGIMAPFPFRLCGLDALTVKNPRARLRVSSSLVADAFSQGIIDLFPDPSV